MQYVHINLVLDKVFSSSYVLSPILGSPNIACANGIYLNEAISTCLIYIFEKLTLLCKVGTPIPNKTLDKKQCLLI